jgi:hypothetical protein
VTVELNVYDLARRRVRRLKSGFAPAGEHAVVIAAAGTAGVTE